MASFFRTKDQAMTVDMKKKTYLGQPVERVEDAILLMGKAQFSDHLPTRAGT